MPNWVEGSLKVRSKDVNNIKEFFKNEFEVINGEITLFNEIHYNDWDWECPMPRMGG